MRLPSHGSNFSVGAQTTFQPNGFEKCYLEITVTYFRCQRVKSSVHYCTIYCHIMTVWPNVVASCWGFRIPVAQAVVTCLPTWYITLVVHTVVGTTLRYGYRGSLKDIHCSVWTRVDEWIVYKLLLPRTYWTICVWKIGLIWHTWFKLILRMLRWCVYPKRITFTVKRSILL